MARTAAGARLTQAHRQTQLRVRAAALRDVTRLWRGVNPTNLAGTIGTFAAAGAVVIAARNRESAEAAARYYEQFRTAEQVPGDAGVDLAAPPPDETIESVIRGAGLAGILTARGKGFSPQAAAGRGLVRVFGSASNLTLAGGRDTIFATIGTDDRSTRRWQRVTSGSPCAFCTMLAARGPVFVSQEAGETVVGRSGRPRGTRQLGESFHDHCNCTAEPVYEGSQLPAVSERLRDLIEGAGLSPDVQDLNAIRQLLAA